ncbi:phosphate ABC transporter permease subunit PstC [Halorhodospira abdelmalekii]|uniref:phosphate ABC transporter permease subunit PstC n=1 Tax=Halorhodospira abdelmalekii TaxID=421629 RepID=UPI0019084F5F|nr:phosphate ABC transporter permease subunit PstC [Halorhodospira abdelmalekii]MBK1735986.1 phosphate ABC transporter permease subunit PstC [Halorhodospira abdelmalekii]
MSAVEHRVATAKTIRARGLITNRTIDLIVHIIFLLIGASGIILLALIALFLMMEGLPIFEKISFWDFITGTEWYPTYVPPDYGILPMIAGTASVVALSALFAIPLGIGTALYLAEIAPSQVRSVVKPVIELIEGLPTVVIGFFGMVVVAPWMQNTLGISTGLNVLNAAIMLAFMSVPTIASIAEDAIYSVPKSMREGALALGATRWETIYSVVFPASLTGISTAVVLGLARAIGETMVVLMVAGGAAIIPESIFDPVRPMPANIAAEMGNAPFRGEHYHALFAIGLILFFITFMFNAVATYFANKYRQFE